MTIIMKRNFRIPTRPATFFLSIFVMLSGFGICSAVVGQEIYKSVDDDGNVIYSEEPPEDGEETTIIQPDLEPSAEEVKSAIQKEQQLEDDTNAQVQEVLQHESLLESERESATDDLSIEPGYEDDGVVGDPLIRRGVRETNRRHNEPNRRHNQR